MAWTRPIWRLTRNALGGSPRRTRLLVLAVAAATALLSAVGCALESLNAGIDQRMTAMLGKADLRMKRVGDDRFDVGVMEEVRRKPEVDAIAPRAKGAMQIRRAGIPSSAAGDPGAVVTASVDAIDPSLEYEVSTPSIMPGGRAVANDNEVVIDAESARALGVRVGDEVEALAGEKPLRLKLVGVTAAMPVKAMRQAGACVTLNTLWAATGFPGRVNEVRIVLKDDRRRPDDARALAARWSAGLPKDIYIEPTAPVSSGLKAKSTAARMVFLLVSSLGFIASAFIVLTGLTTNMLERQRELAIMRCIGATGAQLAAAQLGVGAALGACGALIGVPVGMAMVYTLTRVFADQFSAGFRLSPLGLAVGTLGAVGAGVAGAAWPALRAARLSPMAALGARAKRVSSRWVWVCTLGACAALAWQLYTVWLVPDAQTSFWLYASTGLPAMFTGYFLMGVPVCLLVTRIASRPVAALLRLPPTLLGRFTAQHPFRNGFTAGALMVGLALMTVIWTVGGSVFRDVLGGFKFPDAFVQSWAGLTPDMQRRINELPFVEGTCAVSLVKVDGGKIFGIRQFGTRQTTFIAFEPEPFFRLTNLKWEAGDPEYAKRRLAEGGAVLVAREFLVAQSGYKVGDRFPLVYKGVKTEFEIVGAVSSPGLEVLNGFFDIGKQYAEQAMSAVFGSRADLKKVFGTEAIHLIQVSLKDGAADADAVTKLREVAGPTAMVGSGREIKELIGKVGSDALRVASIVAVSAILIACFGVGNIVTAGIDARRFEFGVLRAVGADAALLVRLVLAEVVLVALAACVLGTVLGLQGSMAGVRMHHMLLGLNTQVSPPWGAIGVGWLIVLALATLSAWPIIARAARSSPRALLAGSGD